MATLVKTYQFDSAQGWAYTANGDGSGTWQSSGGNSGGCWAINCYGRSNLEEGYLELSTTWEALGVPANSTINEIDVSSLDWLCDVFNVADSYTIGALEVRCSQHKFSGLSRVGLCLWFCIFRAVVSSV